MSELQDAVQQDVATLVSAREHLAGRHAEVFHEECIECDRYRLTVEVGQLRAERDRERPVVEAAKALRETASASSYLGAPAALVDLIAAVDALPCICPRTAHDYNGTTVYEQHADGSCPVHGYLHDARPGKQEHAGDSDYVDIDPSI